MRKAIDGGPERLAEYENVVTTNYQKFVLSTGYKGFEPLPPAVPKEAAALDQVDQKPAPKPKKKRSSPTKRIKMLAEI